MLRVVDSTTMGMESKEFPEYRGCHRMIRTAFLSMQPR